MARQYLFVLLLIYNFGTARGQGLQLVLPVGHTGFITENCFSTNGKYILTGSYDKTAKLWDAKNGQLLRTFEFAGQVTKVLFSPGGETFFTGTSTGEAIVWDFKTLTRKLTLETEKEMIYNACYSPSGEILVTQQWGYGPAVWNVNKGQHLFYLKGHKNLVTQMQFSGDGQRLFTFTKADSMVYIWNMADGTMDGIFRGQQVKRKITAIACTHNGNQVAMGFETGLMAIFDPEASKARGRTTFSGFVEDPGQPVTAIAFSPNDRQIAIANEGGTVLICDTGGKTLYHLQGHHGSVGDLIYSNNGQLLASAGNDGTCIIWDAATGRLKHRLQANVLNYGITLQYAESKSGTRIQFSPDDNYLLTRNVKNIAQVWSTQTGNLHCELKGYARAINTVELNPADSRYAVATTGDILDLAGGKDSVAYIFDLSNGTVKCSLNGHSADIKSCRYNNAGNRIITASDDSTAKIWDAQTGALLFTTPRQKGSVLNAAYSSAGSLFFTRELYAVTIWNAANLQKIKQFSTGEAVISTVQFSPDEKQLAVYCDLSRQLIIYDCTTGKKAYSLPNDHQWLGYAPGNTFLTTNSAGQLNVWHAATGQLLRTLQGAGGKMGQIVFNADSSIMAAFTDDSSVITWSLPAYKILYRITNLQGNCYFAAFTPNGKNLLTATYHSPIRLWNLANGENYRTIGLDEGMAAKTVSFDLNTILVTQNSTLLLGDLKNGTPTANLIALGNRQNLTYIKDGYYQCSKDAARLLHYVTPDLRTISFEQLDVKYNRPDKVLQALGTANGAADTLLVNSYYHAWQKRIKKLGVDTTAFGDDFSVPEGDFKNRNDIAYEQSKPFLQLQVQGADSKYALAHCNVWVNEVPLFGLKGLRIPGKAMVLDTAFSIALSAGVNKIEFSVTNTNGIESYRAPLYVNYTTAQPPTETLYFAGIGINHYNEAGHELKWSVKDIQDLAASLKKQYGNNIQVSTLYDEQVNRQNILQLKQFIQQAGVNDKVIIAFSGHGLLSKTYDYYLSTYNVNFSNPQINGLAYEDLEWLLDSIPARQKLMLIDACHSGELDKEAITSITALADTTMIAAGSKGATVLNISTNKTIGLSNSFELMQDVFANVNRGTGATIISAAGGTQFARESGTLKNGVFTFTILELMQQKKNVKVSELKQQVSTRVPQLTNGNQKPTSRNETIENDWKVW